MTTCTETQAFISRLQEEGTIPSVLPADIQQHVDSCQSCALMLRRSRDLAHGFSRMRAVKITCPDTVFTNFSQTLRQIEQQQKPDNVPFIEKVRRYFMPLAVTCAALVIIAAGIIFIASQQQDPKLIASSETERNKPVTITLNYNASDNIDNVTFSLALDAELVFESDIAALKSMKQTSWKGSLKKGNNQIPFVVSALKNGEWKINAEAKTNDLLFRHKVVLTVSDEKIVVAYLEYPVK